MSDQAKIPRMERQCAFCASKAKLTAEHLWSEWINDLIPGPKRLTMSIAETGKRVTYIGKGIDWKLKVVCANCNNRWMSDIENDHAKPSMTDLILGKVDLPISDDRAYSMALFAFKTALVLDMIRIGEPPFFNRAIRYRFRKYLTIPINVSMFLTAFAPSGHGEISPVYHNAQLPKRRRVAIYVCTFSAQRLVLQVVSFRQRGISRFATKDNFGAVPSGPRFLKDLFGHRSGR